MNRKLLSFALFAFVTPACVGLNVDDESLIEDLDDSGSGDGGNVSGTGGRTSTGGSGSGAGTSTGGAMSSGGSKATGGAGATGGAAATGGAGATGGAAATGGATATGGTTSATGGAGTGGTTVDPDGCIPMATDTDDSGSIGVAAICFTLTAAPKVGWQVNNLGSRTMTVNGASVSSGQLPFPGSAPYVVEFSAGEPEYTSWSFW